MEGKDDVIVISLGSLVKGGDMTQNVQISDEDTVYVASAGMCYVTGEVKQPGTYPCGEGATVLKLVTLAQGFSGKLLSPALILSGWLTIKRIFWKKLVLTPR